MQQQNEFFNTKEAAEYLSLQKNTLEVWRVKGGGPSFCKFGRAIRYRKSDLDAFVEQCVCRSTSDQAINNQ